MHHSAKSSGGICSICKD